MRSSPEKCSFDSNGQDPPQVSSMQFRSTSRVSEQAVDGTARESPRLVEPLLGLEAELMSTHIRLVAHALGSSERTVWRWLTAGP